MQLKHQVVAIFILGLVSCSVSAPALYDDDDDDCKDRQDCSGYDIHTACCGAYEAFSRYNCPRHCRFCTPKVTEAPLCTDTIPNCEQYGADLCTNTQYEHFVQTNCAGYCKLCEKGPYIPYCAQNGTTPAPVTTPTTPEMTTTIPYDKCHIGGGAYKAEGETWETIDCSKRCTCINGLNDTIECETITCPKWIHNCDLIEIEGSCCPLLKCNYFNTVHGPADEGDKK